MVRPAFKRAFHELGVGIVALAVASAASAGVVSDEPAAIVIWPDVTVVATGRSVGSDTIIQLSNTSNEPIAAHCFYENANYHCADTGQVCVFASECCGAGVCAKCEAGWVETDFRVRLTPRQPIGWTAEQGLGRGDFPLTGAVGSTGIGGSSNAGSSIPPVPESVYNGTLKCIAINDDGTPSDRNVLKGEATRVSAVDGAIDGVTVAKHNAIGIKAIEGAINDDRELVLGGGGAEYEGCSEFLIVNHFFDGIVDPIIGDTVADEGVGGAATSTVGRGGLFTYSPGQIGTRLTLVPCTQDLRRQIPGSAVVQYLVYNEFEQRFSTSDSVDCKFEKLLSSIDTVDAGRSIFSAGVAGTVVGQSRLRAIGSGLVGIATEARFNFFPTAVVSGGLGQAPPPRKVADEEALFSLYNILGADQADFNIHQQGDRAESDVITLP